MKIPKENINIILERIEELKNIPNMIDYNEDGFGTQCDININDPIVNNLEENERIQSELFKKAVEEFRNRNKDPKDLNFRLSTGSLLVESAVLKKSSKDTPDELN